MYIPGQRAADPRPSGLVYRLEYLTGMDQFQRGHQPGHFHRLEQVGVAGRAPALAPLGGQEGLHQEDAAGGHAASHVGHPCSIKITEQENGIKNTEFRPGLLQVKFQPGNQLSGTLRLPAGFRQPGAIAVHRHHRGAEGGGGTAVTATSARQVQDSAAGADQVRMGTEPVAGALVIIGG